MIEKNLNAEGALNIRTNLKGEFANDLLKGMSIVYLVRHQHPSVATHKPDSHENIIDLSWPVGSLLYGSSAIST